MSNTNDSGPDLLSLRLYFPVLPGNTRVGPVIEQNSSAYGTTLSALGCHILFLGKAQSVRIPIPLANLRNAPVLTVGETSGFLGAGGMICFRLEADKVRFDINLDAAESARLKIGSRLLFLAQIVLGGQRR